MNREQFDKVVNDTIKATGGLLIAKGAEYAGDADRLANFKRNAEKQGTTALQIWKQYIGKHLDSIDSYVKRVHVEASGLAMRDIIGTRSTQELMDTPPALLAEEFHKRMLRLMPDAMERIDNALSEPIEGRFHDVINYCLLGLALVQETRDGAA